MSAEEVEKLLDFSSYYQLQDLAVPVSQSERLRAMVREGVIVRKYGEYYITNLGALLFARRMNDFDVLLNKNVRLIRYQGTDKLGVQQALEGTMGYAVGIENLLDYTMVMLPSEEYLHGGTRKIRQVFLREAIRELMANMLIHQDLSVVGYSPRVEIYENRVEFSNPGEPIIAVDRFLSSNQSRNPRLAKLMRQMKLCEERGMVWT